MSYTKVRFSSSTPAHPILSPQQGSKSREGKKGVWGTVRDCERWREGFGDGRWLVVSQFRTEEEEEEEEGDHKGEGKGKRRNSPSPSSIADSTRPRASSQWKGKQFSFICIPLKKRNVVHLTMRYLSGFLSLFWGTEGGGG